VSEHSVTRRWAGAWIGATLLGVANGALREATFARWLGERRSEQVSGATLATALALYLRMLQRRWPIRSRAEAARIGAVWVTLTVGFEFAFGRIVGKQSSEGMLSAYDLREGNAWPLVLAWIGVGPEVVRRLTARGRI
jgi:hypothetical protein